MTTDPKPSLPKFAISLILLTLSLRFGIYAIREGNDWSAALQFAASGCFLLSANSSLRPYREG